MFWCLWARISQALYLEIELMNLFSVCKCSILQDNAKLYFEVIIPNFTFTNSIRKPIAINHTSALNLCQ